MVNAYVMITAEAGEAAKVVEATRKIAGVKSVDGVTGPYDAIALIEAENFEDMGNLIVSKIQKIKGVIRTLTCIIVQF